MNAPRDLIPDPHRAATARSKTPGDWTISFDGDDTDPDDRAVTRAQPKKTDPDKTRPLHRPLAGKGSRGSASPTSS
ncbi:MAG TPA: hypothetical protein VIK91_15780, partial [Nannocystis sp.]